jgi:hypothetical protein
LLRVCRSFLDPFVATTVAGAAPTGETILRGPDARGSLADRCLPASSRRSLMNVSASLRRAVLCAGLWPLVGCSSSSVDPAPRPKPDFPDDAAVWRMRRYHDEHGAIPARAWQIALEAREQVVAATAALPAAGGVAPAAWVSRGPDNVAGRSRSLLIDPRDPQRLFAGSVSGGVWRSTNGGTTWTQIDDWWRNLSVGCMAMDPSNPDVMYVGTGEGFYSLAHLQRSLSHFVRGAGVLKTTDGGATWTHLATTGGWAHVTRIAVHPTNGSILLAARRQGGIARSIDGGATWADVMVGEQSFQVVFDPNDGNKAVAHFSGPSPLVHAVLTSSDAGATWQAAASGLTSVAGEGARIELAYARSAPGTVYASVASGGGTVWRSTDGGRNWVQRGSGTSVIYYYNGLWVDPTDANRLVVGALHVWRSTDGGQTFTQTTNGYIMTVDPHLDVHAVVADPGYNGTTNRRVYVMTDGGVHVANDILAAAPGSGWRDLDATMRSTQFYGAAGHGTGDVIVGGAQDNGTLRVMGANRSANLAIGGDGGQVQIDPTDPRYVYGEIQYLGVHRSTNGGASSTQIISGLSDATSGSSNFISPLRLDPNNPSRLYAGGARLWRNANARTSSTWSSVKASVGSLTSAIAIAPGVADRILVGHNDGRVYRTANGTAASPTWQAVDDNGANNPLPGRVCTRLVFDPNNASVVYATFGGFSLDNLWRSTDAGTTWQALPGTAPFVLPAAPVYGLAVHPDDSNVLYAATEVGLFASDDAGQHWTATNQGPANVVVEDVSFMHGTRRLLLATLGRGFWTADVARPRAVAFGTDCGQPNPPTLGIDPLAPARVGQTFTLQGAALRIGQPFVSLLLGASNSTWSGTPLPLSLNSLGMTSCQLFVSIDLSLTAAISAVGTASWPIPLPDNPSLVGATLYAQLLMPDPGVNAAGFVTSRALELGIGW